MDKIIFKSQDLTPLEIESAALLHAISIQTGFLSSLGKGFLTLLYNAIAHSEAGMLIVALDGQGKVVGFVSGTTAKGPIYAALLRKNFFILPFVLLPKIISFKNMRKIVDLMVYPFRSGKKEGSGLSAELLSLAVDEKYRGQGVAQGLFKQLVDGFRERGVKKFEIVVGDPLIPAQRFYAKMGAQKESKLELHKGEMSWVYVYETAV